MVTCQFVGRLGNQLWQIGATVNYALTHNMEFAFPHRTASEKDWPMMFKNLPRTSNQYPSWNQPTDGGYYKIPYSRNLTLRGFFQSYKYIDHPETLNVMKGLIGYENQPPKKGVAIHVRRGDYVNLKDTFPCLPLDYYKAALKSLLNTKSFWIIPSEDFHIFSDDIEWCKNNFFNPECTFHKTGDPIEDLFEMSRYEHQIIANSSYSYWAAMLNPNPDKIVICPHHTQYYGPKNSHLKTEDLFPPEWRQVKF